MIDADDDDDEARERRSADVIAEAIAATSGEIDDRGAYCSGWVLVAAWLDTEGSYWLTRMTDERTPRWQTIGMLRTAQLQYEYEMTSAADDDD